MTELTYTPNPEEILKKMQCVDMRLFTDGDENEKTKLKELVKWCLVLVHCIDIKRVPKQDRHAVEVAERETGVLSAKILLAIDSSTSNADRQAVMELFRELVDSVWYVCEEVDENLAVSFMNSTKCPT